MNNRLYVDSIETIGFVGKGDDPEAEIVFFKKAPEEDESLLTRLLKSLGLKKEDAKKLLAGDGADGGSEPDSGPDDGDGQMTFDVTKMDDETKAAFDAAVDAAAIAKLAVTDDGDEGLPADLPESVSKALDDMKAQIEKADARAQKAEAEVSELSNQREKEVYIRKVASLGLPGASADDFAPILRKAEAGMTADEVEKFNEVLKSASEAIKMTAEIGRVGHEATSVEAEVNTLAKQYRDNDPTLTVQLSRAQVWKDHPALFAKYRKERDAITKLTQGG